MAKKTNNNSNKTMKQKELNEIKQKQLKAK